jgi:hypothetical protein
MSLVTDNSLFSDLNADEIAGLNGGYRCRVVQVRICTQTIFGLRCVWRLRTRCF